MAKVIINDEEFEAVEDESLLDVARRNGAHIGFACNGNGLCTTCECKVLEGAELLTPYNEVEDAWLPASRKEQGYRLACQCSVEPASGSTNTLKVITRVEILKRQLFGANLLGLLGFSWQTCVDHVRGAPAGFSNGINRLGLFTFLFPFNPINKFIGDTGKIFNRQLGQTRPVAEIPPAQEQSV